MEILLLIGLAVLLGVLGGKFLQRLKTPQVVGYIVVGVVLGGSFLGVLPPEVVDQLTPLSNFALGLIGFMIGGELKFSVFRRFGRTIFTILFSEVFGAFLLVTLASWLITGKLYIALIFGALATATAPAATVDVLWEYRAQGTLTTTIFAIVGLDDALALIVYAFAASYSKALIGQDTVSLLRVLYRPLLEIGASVLLGGVLGILLGLLLHRVREEKQLLPVLLGLILICTGLANHFHLSQILANMCLGMTIANLRRVQTRNAFRLLENFNPPIYILFFVLIGSRLRVDLLPQMGLAGLAYILGRTVGKWAGSYLGACISRAEDAVRRYLGFALFSQAGVAIGLSIAVYQDFSRFGLAGQELSILVLNVITATTFIVQLIGPSCVKYAITKAGEIGRRKG